jgi:outer membrane cobalamin receptor
MMRISSVRVALCGACSAGAQNVPAAAVERLEPIVVTAKKRSDPGQP